MEITYDYLPPHMQDGARRYVEDGIPPGGFMRAVLENRLVESFGRADTTNFRYMDEWARWLYNEAPSKCWGSPEAVEKWIESKQQQQQNAQRRH